jgi:sugar phosphate isomerase/epimerase
VHTVKLSCADFTWPNLRHQFVLDLIAELGFDGVDLGLYSPDLPVTPALVRENTPLWAGIIRERLATRGLEAADVFVMPSLDLEEMSVNNPDPAQQARAAAFFHDMLDFVVHLGAPGMSMAPGTRFGDEPWDGALRRSAEGLQWRVEAAAQRGVRLSIEPALRSHVATPERLGRLLDLVPGLELTLDYAQFAVQGIADAEVEPFLARTRHFHCRGAKPGMIQARFQDNTIDFGRIIRCMHEIDYDGYFAMEYVYDERPGYSECDTLQETIRFRDFARDQIAAYTWR